MERVFADTGYWIALLNSRDELHRRALAVSHDFGRNQIVTSEMLTEFLNSSCDYGPHLRQAAAEAVGSLLGSDVIVIPRTAQLFANALQRYRAMADKNWSLTDCASF